MKFVAPISVVAATSMFMLACGGSSRPAGKPPSGPPPEYEAPRSFELPKAPGEEPPPSPREEAARPTIAPDIPVVPTP